MGERGTGGRCGGGWVGSGGCGGGGGGGGGRCGGGGGPSDSNPSTYPKGLSTQRQLELTEQELLIVKLKTPQNNADGRRVDEKIPKEEAVCKICFKKFADDDVLKTKCGCKFTLLHENCRNQISGTNCRVCHQDTLYVPVMLIKVNNEKQSSSKKRFHKWTRYFKRKA